MQPSDSLPPVGRGSGRPWPVAYPVPRATRRKKSLPGAWAVLFQRAVGSDPAGCASRLAHRVETAIAFRLHNALGPQFPFPGVVFGWAENRPTGTVILDPQAALTAADADAGDTLTYTLEGTDAASFDFDPSIRKLKAKSGVTYDFEATKNVYRMTVRVVDGNGGTDTTLVTINLLDVRGEQSTTPDKPTLAAVSGSSTSLTASWTKPGRNGGPHITGYGVQYREGTTGTWMDFTHSDTAITTTITGLTADTSYQVQVRALNGDTPSDWSDPSDAVRTNLAELSIPPGLEVTLHLSDNEPFEDTGRPTVTASVSPASPVAFTVEISASPVEPATDDDFELSTNRTLSFAANATGSTGTVRISPVSDDDPEPNDVVTVSGVVSNPAIPNPDDVTLTILNDDADLPQDIAIDAPAAVDEGAGTANVTVTLTTQQNTAPAIDAQLFYRPRSETATPGDDYTRPQSLGNRIAIVPVSAFSPNADGTAWVARHSFEIGIVDDGEAEPEETIKFAIYTNSNNSGTKQTIRIRDNDTPVMRNVRVVNGPGAAGMWSAGEQVELEVRYTLPVAVEQPSSYDECWSYNADGTCKPPGPYVAVVFRSDARPGYGEVLGVALARYVSGSGTATLRFAYTVGTAEAGARGVEVVDGKVLLRGATIRPLGGGDDVGPEFTRTRVMRVDVQKPGGGAWTAGDKVRVTVKFTGPGQRNLGTVKVDKTGGTPTIGLRLGDPENRLLARTASYKGGSGSNTLSFEYAVTAGDGRISAVEVVPNSLARNGATIRNKQGYDAELDHLGVLWYSPLPLRVRDAAAREGETLRFTMELAQAAKAPVTVDYETADGTATAGEDYEAKRGTEPAPGRCVRDAAPRARRRRHAAPDAGPAHARGRDAGRRGHGRGPGGPDRLRSRHLRPGHRRHSPPRRCGDDRRPALHAEHDAARGPHARLAGAVRTLANGLPRAEAAAPADVQRVVRPADCQADSGGRLPGGHHPQTHDGKTGARHPARLTRRATGMGRPWSRRRRSGWWAGLPTEDRSINSHEETAPGDDSGANRPVGAQMFQVSLVDRNVYVY